MTKFKVEYRGIEVPDSILSPGLFGPGVLNAFKLGVDGALAEFVKKDVIEPDDETIWAWSFGYVPWENPGVLNPEQESTWLLLDDGRATYRDRTDGDEFMQSSYEPDELRGILDSEERKSKLGLQVLGRVKVPADLVIADHY